MLRKKSAGNVNREGGSRIPICADTARPLSGNVGVELEIPAALGGLQGEAAAVSAQGRQAPCPLIEKNLLLKTPHSLVFLDPLNLEGNRPHYPLSS